MVHCTLFPNSGPLAHLIKLYQLLAWGPKFQVVRFQFLKVCVTTAPLLIHGCTFVNHLSWKWIFLNSHYDPCAYHKLEN